MRLLYMRPQSIQFFAHIGSRRQQCNLLRNPLISGRGLINQILQLRAEPFTNSRGLGSGGTCRIVGEPADFVRRACKHFPELHTLGTACPSERIER